MRQFNTIDVTNTVGQFVQAFNNNALASADHTWYLGELFFNGILYTGLETIGGTPIKSLTNLNISTSAAQNLELDNFYLYFRKINKILLVDGLTIDLDDYNDNKPYYVYINSNMGYRVTQEFRQNDEEIRLFRFRLGTDNIFKECYVLPQRFGTSTYDAGQEFYDITGLGPIPLITDPLGISLEQGYIQRSGIKFDVHQLPDIYSIAQSSTPYNLRYITAQNEVDYTQAVTTIVDTTKVMDYVNNAISDAPNDKFTVQRILFDIYENTLVMQYGNAYYDTMELALSSLEGTNIPFPYNEVGLYVPIGLMFVKTNVTNLNNVEECILIPQTSISTKLGTSYFFAEDAYARGRLEAMQNQIDDLAGSILDATGKVDAHISNKSNPHEVTKSDVGLGNVPNLSYDELKTKIHTDSDGRYVNVTGDTMTGPLAVNNVLSTNQAYIEVGGRRLYIGSTPTGADVPNSSYAIK